jgi:hypothetical protein
MSAGVLVVFCLIGGSLGLLVWWLFVKRSGFVWKSWDWQDYKASVLRRPEERPDDAITVFSDGTARKGGGSSVGTRSVVLGELDTTYTKSYVRKEKPFGPRPEKKRGLLESVWGRLRGGEGDDADTQVMREKSLSRGRYTNDLEDGGSFVDRQRPAPPLTDITSSDTPLRKPSRFTTRARRAKTVKKTNYVPGNGSRGNYKPESESTDEDSSSDESSSDEETSSDEESELDRSQLGMAKGNKVYHHPISQDRVFWGNARPVEKNGGGAGGTYGGGAPALMPRGYRAGSVGSLSSEGSVVSSNAGR